MWRRGKHLVFDLELASGGDRRHLLINPMLGGRFQLADADSRPPATHVFSLRLEREEELRYLDFRDMGRIYWTPDPAGDVPAWPEMGPEADALSEMGLDVFRHRLRRYRDELKDLLRNQSFCAGIGNAYSDEILHAAKMSPFALTSKLTDEQITTLYEAMRQVETDAVERSVGQRAAELKGEKRAGMRVHARTGLPCPVCGDTVREVSFADKSLQYCATCQTGGKPLADRRLSKLIR
jgi:formamidopyrimidine-DNA glycosylase